MIAGGLSDPGRFWSAYLAWRLRIAAQPFSEEEEARADQVRSAMTLYLGLAEKEAVRQARRAALYRRERIFHETLLLDLAPARLGELLDRLDVAGLDNLPDPGAERGLLLVAPHYGPFSSLLPLWLARAARDERLSRLSILIDTGRARGPGIAEERIEALEQCGLGLRSRTRMMPLGGGVAALRAAARALGEGATVLLFPDVSLEPDQGCHGMPLAIGLRRVRLRGSIPWLAGRTGCAVRPVHVRARGDTHEIVFSPAPPDEEAMDGSFVQKLFDRTVLVDPAPWEGWTQLP